MHAWSVVADMNAVRAPTHVVDTRRWGHFEGDVGLHQGQRHPAMMQQNVGLKKHA